MTKAQLSKKADQLLAIGVRLEQVLNTLPKELRSNETNLKSELSRLISRVERAAA